MRLVCAFARRMLKNSVEQWGRARLWSQLESSDHRGHTERCSVREEVSLLKRKYLLKILSWRYPRSFPLGENGELTYGSQFNFISDPNGGRWKENWIRFIMKNQVGNSWNHKELTLTLPFVLKYQNDLEQVSLSWISFSLLHIMSRPFQMPTATFNISWF